MALPFSAFSERPYSDADQVTTPSAGTWGGSTWGDGGWGGAIPVTVAVTGVAATSSVGNETVTGSSSVSLTGVSGTGGIGSVTIIGAGIAGVSGTGSTLNLGEEIVTGTANVSVTGVSGTSAVGNETAFTSISIAVSGLSGTSAVGNETVTANSTLSVTGLSATGAVGNETVTAGASVSATGLSATGAVGSVTVSVVANITVSAVGVLARGNEDLAGAFNAEYFVPEDSNNPNITVVSYEASTTVYADGSSLGTISSAGGTLSVSASNYENKIISANKPITLQNTDNESIGVPTSWAGYSFGIRNTRTGVRLQMRALFGTANVTIFKDGTLTTTKTVASNTTTIQSYSDDTSDPEYTIYSDIPIMVFKSANSDLTTDTRSVFPATTDALYGVSSGSSAAIRVEGYGESNVTISRFDSNGGSATGNLSTTTSSVFANGTDFTGPTNKVQAPKGMSVFTIADSDGGEKTSYIPEGAFANEFRLIEAAEFVCFMGAGGTNGKNIQVYNSSGTLIDTVQLATSNTDSSYPTKFQLISNSTTDSSLTPNKKSYDLTAGMRFVSEVPVGAIVEDDSSDNEENLLGLRYASGISFVLELNAIAAVTGLSATTSLGNVAVDLVTPVDLTGVSATGQVSSVTVDTSLDNTVLVSGVGAVTSVGNVTIIAIGNITVDLTGLSSTTAIGEETIIGDSNLSITGEEAIGRTGDMTISGASVTGVSGIGSTVGLGDETVTATANIFPTGVEATGGVGSVIIQSTYDVTGVEATTGLGSVTATGASVTVLTGEEATSVLGSVTVTASAAVSLTGEEATSSVGDETVTGDASLSLTGEEATSEVGDETVVTSTTVVLSNIPQLTSALGDETVSAGADVDVTGEEATTVIGDETVTGDASVTLENAEEATGTLGNVTVETITFAPVTGEEATATVGTVTVTGTCVVVPTGLQNTAILGKVLVWGRIVPDQVPNYSEISPSQTPSWSQETTSQTPSWTETSTSQTPSWSEEEPSQNPNWTEEAA